MGNSKADLTKESNLVPSIAPSSSKLGIVIFLRGATTTLDATNTSFHKHFPHALKYTQQPNARSAASAKTSSSLLLHPIHEIIQRHLGIFYLLVSLKS